LVPRFEKESGLKVTTIFTGTLDVQKRIAAGEAYDLIIMAGPAIDDFIKAGKIVPGSRVDLAKSGVGVGVRAGAPKPDISSTEALKKAWAPNRSATPPAPAASTSHRCSSAWASPQRWRPSSSRPRPAFSSAASWRPGKPRSACSR
jgi:molybdate transport system substrate-binding protein